jgi:hypothetical protein
MCSLGLSVGMPGGQGNMHTTGAQPSTAVGGTIALEVADLAQLVER